MPHNWGQRYFEGDPPHQEHSPGSDNDKRRRRPPQFHEVFGSNKHRRGRFRGRPRGNRFNAPRTPQRPDNVGSRERGDDQYVANDRRDIFSARSSRPAFEQRDSGGRKRRKYVPGGLIPKFERIEEYKGDTYCDICQTAFRDIVAKAVHDRSHDHRLNYAYIRNENQEKGDEDVDENTTTRKESEEDRRKNLEDGMTAFLSLDLNTLPKPFREWMDKSLAAARKAADEANDPSLFQAVQREVVEVYRVNDKNCSLRRVCWARKELASGRAYRESQSITTPLPVIPDAKVFVRDANMSKKEEVPRADSSAPSPRPTVRDPEVEVVANAETVDDAENASIDAAQYPPDNAPPTNGVSVLPQDQPPYPKEKQSWCNSRAAEMMHSSWEVEHSEDVLARCINVFGRPKGRTRDSDHQQEGLEPTESLKATYRELCSQYDSEEYNYKDLMQGLSTVAEKFDKGYKHIGQLRRIYQMQIQTGLQQGEFCDIFVPCSKYVDTFSMQRSEGGRGIRLVGHWLVSLLFQNKSGSRHKRFPAMLEVAQEMRKLPEGAKANIWVYEAIEAVRCVLGNNWKGFFGRNLSSLVHMQDPTSKQMLTGLVPFMRERAIIVMMQMRIGEMRGARVGAERIRLVDALKLLGWDSCEDVESSVAEAKDFISALPQPFEIILEEDNSEWIGWRGSDDDLRLSDDTDAKADMLTKWGRPVVLEED